MKVIFLDIDGVLNSTNFEKNNSPEPIDSKNAALLKELTEKTGAVLVLSSGWKCWFDDEIKPETEEAAFIYSILCEHDITLFDKTPDYSTEEIRRNRTYSIVKANEIKAWLSSHDDIESYIVLDDMDLKDEELRRRTVRIDNMIGLSEEDIDRASKILEQKLPHETLKRRDIAGKQSKIIDSVT